jgi:ammonia channel protein AmtB
MVLDAIQCVHTICHLVLLGAGMLWFGWFGFNAGSALSAGSLAATAMINTQIATAAAAMSWIAFEKKRDGKATTLGVASGAIAGAVAITPACGFLNPIGALVLGLIAGVASAWAVTRKYKFGYDDSLDVVGVHGMLAELSECSLLVWQQQLLLMLQVKMASSSRVAQICCNLR